MSLFPHNREIYRTALILKHTASIATVAALSLIWFRRIHQRSSFVFVATGTSMQNSGVTKGCKGAVAPGRSMLGGAEQLHQKYFMNHDYFNDCNSEFDKFGE